FLPIVNGLINLATPQAYLGDQSVLQLFNAAGLSTNNIASVLHGAGGNFLPIVNGLINLATPQAYLGDQSVLQLFNAAGLSTNNIASVLHGAGGNFLPIVNGLTELATPQAHLGDQSVLQLLNAAGLSTNNIASVLHGAGGNFDHIVQGMQDFIRPGPHGAPSVFQHIRDAGLSADQIAHILDGAGSNFGELTQQLQRFVTSPAVDQGPSEFQLLRQRFTAEDITRALGSAGGRFSELVTDLHLNNLLELPNRNRVVRSAPFPKTTGQAEVHLRQPFSFAPAQNSVVADASTPYARIVVVMEADDKSTQAARLLCEKHVGETLCIEWNPENKQWRAVSTPGGPLIDPLTLKVHQQAKCVLVGHFREDGTMAAQRPEILADSLVALLGDLGIPAPRKISLTGVCYTAPDINNLAAASESLAGRFAQALYEKGISVPVSGINGEVVVNKQGRKQTVLWNDASREPANLRKVTLAVDDRGQLHAQAHTVQMQIDTRLPARQTGISSPHITPPRVASTATLSPLELAVLRRSKLSTHHPVANVAKPSQKQDQRSSEAPDMPTCYPISIFNPWRF
ncbi:C80 family cysteine peptidase, partial [Robbsia andropogonis]|uniref:C80 family cysteine peptidase n=1 Tax=Robbsia andropogonis TaxID=28092 RepID=UPI0020A1A9E9